MLVEMEKLCPEEDTAVDSNGQVLVILIAVNLLPHLLGLLKPILSCRSDYPAKQQ